MITFIDIPFSDKMAKSAIEGKKLCTTRSTAKGRAGDIFLIQGTRFRILLIMEKTLDEVSDTLFRCEGFESPDEFRSFWRSIHRGHYTGNKVYYVHYFAMIHVMVPS